jgi:hypothetical protein
MSLSAAGVSVLAIAILYFCSRQRARVADDVDVDDDLIVSFVGGLRWALPKGLGTTTMPGVLVGLALYPWGLRLGARWRVLAPFVPSWCVRYEEITAAEHARRGLRIAKRGSHGVRFRTGVGDDPVIFWTSNWSRLLDDLEGYGVPVVRQATSTAVWSNK